MPLIEFSAKGLYCPAGGFYIDPWKPVDRALITHGHSDHARWGSKHYLCHTLTKPILETRLGPGVYETMAWGEERNIGGVKVSYHPAGHIIGSSQIRLEHRGEVWVFTGDYKLEDDGVSGAWEPVRCHTFITECTFGLPIYKWKPQAEIFDDMKGWVRRNQAAGKSSVLFAYSLGKAQRILQPLSECTDRVLLHGAVWNVHQALISVGYDLPPVERVTPDTPRERLKGAVVIAPGSADSTPWLRRFAPLATGICSGWMQVRGNRRRKNADAGFALSDHCDWPALIEAVKATGCERVYATHGFQAAFSRYVTEEMGLDGREVKTEYGADDEEAGKEEKVTANESQTEPESNVEDEAESGNDYRG